MMNAGTVSKVMIFDQGNPVAGQLLGKAISIFGTGSEAPEYITVKVHNAHGQAAGLMENAIRAEKPQLVLIGATALGEEIAPALGVRLGTGVAAHCMDININEEGRIAFMVPAFGGKVIGEIFIPGACGDAPAIATVKPRMFSDFDGRIKGHRIIDMDAEIKDGRMPAVTGTKDTFRLSEIKKRDYAGEDIGKSKLIFCGGFGLGKEENWEKLRIIADRLGGAAGCTRAALDAEWGCSGNSMIGTSGISVRPKVYVGFGVSGATHHICGIKDADVIISINKDKNAEVFENSDYKGVFDAEQVINALLGETER